ncbi:AAA15 family ATPase/GTPase [Erwinia toletana]|uniref:AAA15 family ATPase/GTPase n=1 Tax=Winslowiella toletana TaxID=92490 RepID=A0ABS4P2W2_9GAMM|nr:ATP-binding protein [Winslowiella toletana]MBP2166995.1 AAA15 family ATPase/GTPase [Winslowiella toletana]
MLIEFSVENYRSISERQTLSMVAQKSRDNNDNVMPLDDSGKVDIVRSAAIYGPNAAGKSNLVRAITTMADIIVHSATMTNTPDKIPVTPFMLDSKFTNSPSEFEIIFSFEGVRYQYGFSTTDEKILAEWLFAFPKGRLQRWFTRMWDNEKNEYEWELGNSLVGEKQTWVKATRSNALFLSTAVQLNSKQLSPVYNWFYYKLKYTELAGWNDDYTSRQCFKDGSEEILRFLKAADVGIDDIQVKKEKFNPNSLPDDMPQEFKDLITKQWQGKDSYIVKTLHKGADGNLVAFDLDEESEGTRKIFNFAGPLNHSLKEGNVIIIDELNDNLHPKLVEFIVNLFNNPLTNKNNAQLIFTTHETSILSQDVFRRDQVWFVEKDTDNTTKLFPLSDFSPRKGRENLETAYLEGRYGALPIIKKLEKM